MRDFLISIIVPVYNVEPFILSCIQSVANQSLTDGVECILVDDCGTDNSMKVAERFVAGYKGNIDFHILHHEHNKGLSAARNTGVKHAKGEYILFVDSDDELYPNALESFLGALKIHSGIDMIQGVYNPEAMIRYKGVVLPEYTNDRKVIKTLMLDYDKVPIMAQNRLIKKKLIEDYQLYFKEGIIHEDCYWTFFLAKHVNSLACLSEKTYYYRVNPNSITGKPNKEKEINSFRVIIEDFSNNIDPFLRGEQKTLIWYLLIQAIGSGYYHDEKEKEHLFQCLYHECSNYEKPFMKLWYSLPPNSIIKSRLVNFIIRLYRL
jgi:glycosyltransferase involved in cell wall biosynthesis